MARRRLRSQRTTLRMIAMGGGVVLFLCALGGILFLMWQPYARIHTIGVEGVEILSPAALTANAESALTGRQLVVPRDSIFFFPQHGLEERLTHAFPPIEEVEAIRASFTSITLHVTERSPAFKWCGISTATSSSCYIGDTKGFLFRTVDTSASSTLPYIYGDLKAPEEALRNYVHDRGSTESVLALIQTLHDASIVIHTTMITKEKDVVLSLESGITVFYLLGRESQVAEILPTLLDEIAAEGEAAVEYVDMRFGNRVYVKRRE